MVSFKSLFFFATAALVTANPLQVRSYDADLILVDLKALDDSVKGLTAAIDAYEGAVEAGPILCIIKNLTASDSYTVIKYVTATLGVDIPTGANALEAKKEKFVQAGLEKTMVSSLDLLKYDHESLSQSLAKKFSQEQDVQLKTYVVVKEIDDAIKAGVTNFSS
ncbi:hypothetical protein EG329_009042 [Mollisiaceae sp. DMI_Dod_QoI]|nr:hypothetical protein EG329_009042 [Helotiales sp. DMI_Dod_QoI]